MASTAVERKFKPSGQPKGDARSLKRKRDVDDVEKLQKSVSELVSVLDFTEMQSLILDRILKQK